MTKTSSTLLRARVDTVRYKKAAKVFHRLGMKPGDAINVFLAQVALRQDLPFSVTTQPEPLQTAEEQARNWNQALGEY